MGKNKGKSGRQVEMQRELGGMWQCCRERKVERAKFGFAMQVIEVELALEKTESAMGRINTRPDL